MMNYWKNENIRVGEFEGLNFITVQWNFSKIDFHFQEEQWVKCILQHCLTAFGLSTCIAKSTLKLYTGITCSMFGFKMYAL